MPQRTFNLLGWIFLIAGFVLAVGGINGTNRDLPVFLSVIALAGISIFLFWLGEWTHDRMQHENSKMYGHSEAYKSATTGGAQQTTACLARHWAKTGLKSIMRR